MPENRHFSPPVREVGLAVAQVVSEIVAAEFFSGVDPGEGKGTPVALDETGVTGWRTASSIESRLAASGTSQTYSIRFKSTSGAWSNPLKRTVRIYPKPAELKLPGTGFPPEKIVELQVKRYIVAGTATLDGGPPELLPSGSGTTGNFRFGRDVNELVVGKPGLQSYEISARWRDREGGSVTGGWGSALKRVALVNAAPLQLQTASPGLDQPEIRFALDDAKFKVAGQISLRIGGREFPERALGRSNPEALAALALQIQRDAGLSAVYEVASAGETLSVKLLHKRDFDAGEVSSSEGLVETDRVGFAETNPIFFDVSQRLGTGGEVSKSVSAIAAFGFAAFLPETAWTVAKFESGAKFSVVARTSVRSSSNPLVRSIPVRKRDTEFKLQGPKAPEGAPSVTLALEPGASSQGGGVGLKLSGIPVEVAGGAADFMLNALEMSIRSNPLLGSRYLAEVSGGSLVLKALGADFPLAQGALSDLRGLRQAKVNVGSSRAVAELRYATSDPATPGTVETKIAAEISHPSFVSAVAPVVSFQTQTGVSPVFVRAVSADGIPSVALKRVAVREGMDVDLHPPSAANGGASATLSLVKANLTSASRPGFVLRGVLIEGAWPGSGANENNFLEALAQKIRNHPDLRTVYFPTVASSKLVLRPVIAGDVDVVEISDLRWMTNDSTSEASDKENVALEFTTTNPESTNPAAGWIGLTAAYVAPGFSCLSKLRT